MPIRFRLRADHPSIGNTPGLGFVVGSLRSGNATNVHGSAAAAIEIDCFVAAGLGHVFAQFFERHADGQAALTPVHFHQINVRLAEAHR